jgi:hypothetical protein
VLPQHTPERCEQDAHPLGRDAASLYGHVVNESRKKTRESDAFREELAPEYLCAKNDGEPSLSAGAARHRVPIGWIAASMAEAPQAFPTSAAHAGRLTDQPMPIRNLCDAKDLMDLTTTTKTKNETERPDEDHYDTSRDEGHSISAFRYEWRQTHANSKPHAPGISGGYDVHHRRCPHGRFPMARREHKHNR